MTDNEIIKASGEINSNKIKAIYPHIVVSGDADEPYYSIQWYDIKQKTMICGYSSYNLEFVRKWLQEDFEVVEEDIDNLINRLQAENDDLSYKLLGVMHSVDKWLDGDELKQDEVNRAATMREKTLQITEKQQAEIEKLKGKNEYLKTCISDIYEITKEMVGED